MASIQTGSRRFVQLTDCPPSYIGFGSFIPSVKGTQDGLEFIPRSLITPTTFISLTDCPASYAGAAGMFVKVNSTANGLEFLGYGIRNVSINAVVLPTDYTILMNANGGNRTVGVIDATTNLGKVVNIKKIDATTNTVRIYTVIGGQTIDGAIDYTLGVQYQTLTIQSDGTNWYII